MANLKRNLLDVFKERLAPERQVSAAGRSLMALLDDPKGWIEFLKTVGPGTFTTEFSEQHHEFWDWYWQLTRMRRDKVPITKEVLTFLALWPRGYGKSANIEWAALVEGAMGLEGYTLYVSLTQTSANSHVADIRKRLESSEISKYFPDLADPLIGKHNNRYGWRQDFLITKGGWAIRPLGLDVAVRGLREGDLRPSLIIFDDIDDFKMGVAEVEGNLQTISRSILPTGTPSTIQLVAQNLIAEHSAVNQIYTGKTDILSDHIPSFAKAFNDLEIRKEINERTGKPNYVIEKATPTWPGFDMDACRINLNKAGLEAFYAEYQHDFTLDQTDKVVPEFDSTNLPSTHVITWSQFMRMFPDTPQQGFVPEHWQVAVGLDIGYTAEHLAAWTWIAMSSEDSGLPNSQFLYRGKTFVGKSLTEQVTEVMKSITRQSRGMSGGIFDERDQYVTSRMSHEKLGEQMVLNREYEFNFSPAQFGKEDGIPQWRMLLRVDPTKPHPFHQDELLETGRYKLGRPSMFYVVDDDQMVIPRDDSGLMVHRAQVSEWRRRKVNLTATGFQDAQPMKYKDDANDSTRMILAAQSLTATPLTALQRQRARVKENLRLSDLALEKGNADYNGVLLRRQMEIAEVERQERLERERIAQAVANVLQAPPLSPRFRR